METDWGCSESIGNIIFNSEGKETSNANATGWFEAAAELHSSKR